MDSLDILHHANRRKQGHCEDSTKHIYIYLLALEQTPKLPCSNSGFEKKEKIRSYEIGRSEKANSTMIRPLTLRDQIGKTKKKRRADGVAFSGFPGY